MKEILSGKFPTEKYRNVITQFPPGQVGTYCPQSRDNTVSTGPGRYLLPTEQRTLFNFAGSNQWIQSSVSDSDPGGSGIFLGYVSVSGIFSRVRIRGGVKKESKFGINI